MAVDKLVDSTQLNADLTSVANAIRTKGGTSASLAFPSEFVSAIDAISGGGSGTDIGIPKESTVTVNLLNMFYALENGTAKTGEFTLSTALPNSETLVLSTGLSELNGLFICAEKQSTYITGATPENVLIALILRENGTSKYAFTRITKYMDIVSGNNASSGAIGQFLVRSSYRIDGGNLYVTASFNANNTYTPFRSGITYRWVAW